MTQFLASSKGLAVVVVVLGVVVVVEVGSESSLCGGTKAELQNSGVWMQRWIWATKNLFALLGVLDSSRVVVTVVGNVVVGVGSSDIVVV